MQIIYNFTIFFFFFATPRDLWDLSSQAKY